MTAISCDTIILGGGPVGLALANRALGMNLRVAVIEQQAQIGGLMQDSFLAGHRFDVGTFQFSPADSLFSQFPELLRDFVREVGRTYVRLPDDRFMPWPPTPNRIARSFNEKIKILTSLVTSKIRFRKRSDLAQFCRYYCGDYYFEQYGLKRYIENLFHLPIAEVDMEVAMDRLEFLSKFGVRAFLRRSLEKAPIKATKELCRPHYGFRTLFDRIAVSMRNRGACILTDCAAREINGGPERWLVHTQRGKVEGSTLISTIPMDTVCALLSIPTESKLKSNDMLSLHFCGPMPQDIHILYNFANDKWKSLTNFGPTYGGRGDNGWFSTETVIHTGEVPDAIADDVSRDLRRLLSRVDVVGHTIVRGAYPQARKGTGKVRRELAKRLRAAGVVLAGRQGTYAYVSADDAVRAGQEQG